MQHSDCDCAFVFAAGAATHKRSSAEREIVDTKCNDISLCVHEMYIHVYSSISCCALLLLLCSGGVLGKAILQPACREWIAATCSATASRCLPPQWRPAHMCFYVCLPWCVRVAAPASSSCAAAWRVSTQRAACALTRVPLLRDRLQISPWWHQTTQVTVNVPGSNGTTTTFSGPDVDRTATLLHLDQCRPQTPGQPEICTTTPLADLSEAGMCA
mgnify:CR=1 FL=1